MKCWSVLVLCCFGATWAGLGEKTGFVSCAYAESESSPTEQAAPGKADLDQALREKINVHGLRDLNRTIALLESALDKGLDPRDQQFAENLLSNSLLERSTQLMQVISMRSLSEKGVPQVRQQVTSDLRRVLDFDDPPPIAHWMLAKLASLPGGDLYEARRSLDAYLDSDATPNDQRAKALALRAQLSKSPDKALKDITEATKLEPNNENYKLARVILLRNHNRAEEALVAIEKLLEEEPSMANAIILQGEILRQMNRLDESLASFDRAAKLAPQAPGPYQNRGSIYLEQKNFDKAIEQFTKLLELQPGVIATLVQRAEAHFFAGNLDEALADVDVALQREEQIPAKIRLEAYRIRAEVLYKLNRLKEAIEQIEQITEVIPNLPALKMQLGFFYLQDKRPQQAIAAYTEVLDMNEDNFLALRLRGEVYISIGDHPKAIADYERALQLQSNDTLVLNNLAWILATSPNQQVRDGARAIELATKASELTEYKASHILSTLAAAYAESGNFDTAVKWSQQAINLNEKEQMAAGLTDELSSYREKKPWREKQPFPNNNVPSSQPDEPLTDTPQSIGVEIRQ